MKQNLNRRWLYLIVGIVSMLFAGIVYAWSILKAPLAENFGWGASELTLNFTLTMSFFCIGGLVGSHLCRRIGERITTVLSGILAGVGFILTGTLNGGSIAMLYLTYALMAGLGIGVAYIVIISTVNSWFPDKKGLSSGCLMMGFGASSLVLGNVANAMFAMPDFGWKMTYIILGAATAGILVIAGLIIRRPDATTQLPQPKAVQASRRESFETQDYTPTQMLRRFTFWRAFLFLICLTAVGNSVISFARDLALSVGASAALATTLVGILAVCNGLGRVITGAVFDAMGRRFTMTAASIVVAIAAATTLIAILLHSLPLCIAGLCLTGISYGTSPTIASVFTSTFYGQKHFATNFSITNFNLMCASFVATACSSLLTAFDGYVAPFMLLLALSIVTIVLNLTLKKP